ncbi:MAG: HEAT repeat domain-containing protein [Alphaproteobacteria bacterium]|nr:HEAT repeat domain-containing protein [Alphaproteobacteria bacterium]
MKRLFIAACSLLSILSAGALAQEASEAELRAKLLDQNAKGAERMDAAYKLSKQQTLSDETVAALISVVQDRSDPKAMQFVRQNAVDALRRHPKEGKKALPALLDVLGKDTDKEMGYLRYRTLLALIDIAPEDDASYAAFLQAVDDSESAPRQIGVRGLALAPQRVKEFLPKLKARATDENAQVRAEAAKTLEELCVKGKADEVVTLLPEIVALLDDKENSVAGAATYVVRGLAERGKDVSSALPGLAKLLEHENGLPRKGAIRAIGVIGPKAAPLVPKLVALLEHKDYFVRSSAISALRKIGTPEAVEAVKNAKAKQPAE